MWNGRSRTVVTVRWVSALLLAGSLCGIPSAARAQETIAIDWGGAGAPENAMGLSEPSAPTAGYALEFDGIDDLVYVYDEEPPMRPEDFGDFDFSTHFTIEAWIKPSTLVLGGSLAAIVQGKTGSGGGAFTLNLRTTPPGSWALSVCVPTCDAAISPEDNLDAARWQHVAGVYDGSTITIYRNGEVIAVEPWSGDVSDVVGVVIGRWEVGSIVGFPGVIEDLRVWSTARSHTEILSTMYGGVSGSEPGLMAYWRFNEGSGQLAYDSSVRGNLGYLGLSGLADAADPTWVVYDPPLVFAPSRLFVQRWDPYEPMFDCADEIKPPLDAFEQFAFLWDAVPFEEVLQVDGYHYQFFASPSCGGSPLIDHQWDVDETAGAYGFVHSPSPGASCFRARSWERSPAGPIFSGWSQCCCFDVLATCTPLATPTITGVGGATCGEATLETSPLLSWSEVSNNSGYMWEVWTSTEILVDSGTTANNVSVATVGPLDPGTYMARARALGDGEAFCDSEWSSECSFEITEPTCETLPVPAITAVGDTTCGGVTTDTAPVLGWDDISEEIGYEWELRNSAGGLVNQGTAGTNVTSANLGTLDPGSYVAKVRALGDGTNYCDSDWSTACSFEVLGEVGTTDFAWWPVQPKLGEKVRFVDHSSPTPLSWYWELGDGWTSTEQNPAHVFAGTGNFDVSLQAQFEYGEDSMSKSITVAGIIQCGDDVCEGGETTWSCPTDCALEPEETGRTGGSDRRPSVPAAVGGVEGVGDTFWKTEGWVFNPGPESTSLFVEYTPLGTESVASAGPFDLEPQQGLYWDNIIDELFATTGNGALWLDSKNPVHFLTRSYNLTDHGTFGQGIPGIQQKLTIGRGDGKVFFVGLQEDAAFRSNLFFQEVDGEWVTVHIEVFDESGKRVRQGSAHIGGHSGKLKSLASLGVSDEESVFATVEVTEGDGRVAAISSVVDQITGDPTTADPIHPDQLMSNGAVSTKDSQELHQLVAVVAHTEGETDSVWRTKVVIKNPSGESEQSVRLVYKPEYDETGVVGRSLEKTWIIEAGRQKRWKDVLVDLFEIPASAKTQGTLHIYSPEGLAIRSRTYNERPGGGTFGQEMKALRKGDLIDTGQTGVIIGLRHSPGTRTNIGISEFSGETTEVEMTFFTSRFAPRYLGKITRTVAAQSHKQVTRVFEKLGLGDEWSNDIMAFVTVKQGGSVYVYASTVDNASGDATTTTAMKK